MFENKKVITDKKGNEIRFSSVLNYDDKVHFHDFSIKYVVQGTEFYKINGKKQTVSSGEYVVGNQKTEGAVIIDSTTPVLGICIDISKQTIDEVIAYSYEENEAFQRFIFDNEWMVSKSIGQNTQLESVLKQIAQKKHSFATNENLLQNEIFYSLACCIVKDQKMLFSQFKNLKVVKEETNNRLLHFLYDAKHYIDIHFLEPMLLDEIAKESKLSQFHFIRLFKQVFNITPYQYILSKRLEYAHYMLTNGCSSVEVSYKVGFSNPANFCRAYKKHHGFSPKNMGV